MICNPDGSGQLLKTGDDNDDTPRAYINYILFDENFILQDFDFKRVTEAGHKTGTAAAHDKLELATIVSKPGYLYIYLSNENDKIVDVYFDDLKITHHHSPIVQAADYYPFGGTFNSYQRTNSVEQRYLYNGKEKQDLSDWLDYGARMYMPDLGRFFTQDRFAEKYLDFTPYQYAANNPILYIDVNGDSIDVSGIQSSGQAIVLWLFAQTIEGKAFLSKYAGKGQSVYGHTFEDDGEFHCSGINLIINVKSIGKKNAANGETDYSEDGSYFNISINLNRDLNGEGYAGNDEAAAFSQALNAYRKGAISPEELNNISNAFYFDRLKTLTHEAFIHSDRIAKDYASGERNLLKLSKYEVGRKTHLLEDATPNTPFQKSGLRILLNANNYLNLNKTVEQIKEQMMQFRR